MPASGVSASVALAAAVCVSSVWIPAAAAPADLQSQIDAIRAEQATIAERQRQNEARLHELEARAIELASTLATDAAPREVSADASPRLNVSGDLRLRYQGDYSAADVRERSSAQVRARLGGTLAVNDRVSVGARLVTGDPDDPNSTDVQLSNFDDDLQVSLDLAYARIALGDLTLYGGKIPQPFARTDLVWDGDVNPQGVSAVYGRALADGSRLRAKSLFFIVDENAVAADSTMVGAQLGYDSAAFGDWRLDASAAYYDYRLGSVAGGDAGDFRSNLRNPDGSYRSDFELVDLLLGVTWSGADGRWPVRVLADYVRNLGAATSADTGYSVDAMVGATSKPGGWRLTYGYSVAETDAVLAAFSHDNIGLATDYKLHALTLDYVPWPKTMLSAIWYHYAPLHAADAGPDQAGEWLDRVRLAFLVSF